MRNRILFVVLSSLLGAVSFAERPVAPKATSLQPRVLIIFKNGLSWIEHRGDVVLTDGWGALSTTPEASLGTVSVISDDAKVDEVRTLGASQNAARRGLTLDDLLANNVGRMVTLRVGDRDVSGRLLSSPEQPGASASGGIVVRNAWEVETPAPGIVLLESGGKTTAIQRGLITAATFDGDVSAGAPASLPSLRFHGDRSGSVPVRLSYIRPGIGWFPDYSIVLDGNGRATLTLRATLVNDGEDLRDTDVFFAVGYPNFAFGNIESPLSGRQSLMELFQALGRGSDATSVMSNANIASQQSMRDTGRDGSFDSMMAEGTEGERADDFFLYSRRGITLTKGERASFPLLEASVKYSDIYTLDIPRETQDPYNRPASSPFADKVWHSVRLQNPTKLPWTTAPALAFIDGRPIAQETLHYTPALGETTLRLTVANNVIADRTEAEASRQREPVQRFGYSWDAVTIEGTIDIRNFKDETIAVSITREVEGEAIPSTDLHITRLAAQPRAMNPIEKLSWEIPLKAGEKRIIKYQYKVYVHG